MPPTPRNDRDAFEHAIQTLEAEVANIGAHFSLDASARQTYSREIKKMADELRSHASSGRITWKAAAEQTHEARNAIMEIVRTRSTAVGRAFAESAKARPKPLNKLVAEKTLQLFGPDAVFDRLSPEQKSSVYGEVVRSSGKSNPAWNARMRRLSRAGRGLFVLAMALSVYDVATAEDKIVALKREGAVTGAGIGGGLAGGALAGLACGPGTPVCVTVGAFIGVAAGALGVDLFF